RTGPARAPRHLAIRHAPSSRFRREAVLQPCRRLQFARDMVLQPRSSLRDGFRNGPCLPLLAVNESAERTLQLVVAQCRATNDWPREMSPGNTLLLSALSKTRS